MESYLRSAPIYCSAGTGPGLDLHCGCSFSGKYRDKGKRR